MSAPGRTTGDTPIAEDGRQVARAFVAMSRGYWRGPSAWQAWLLTAGLTSAVLLSIAGNVGVSLWNRWFFDALEAKAGGTAALALGAFVLFAAAITAVSVCTVLTRETLQVRWREWLTGHLMHAWFDRRHSYRLAAMHARGANPEYRFAEDVRWATEPLVDFAIGLLTAVVSIVSFVGILWSVGGALTLGPWAGGVRIPAYMVLAAILQGGLVTVLMLTVGRSLPRHMERRNEAEAQFRVALIRLRDTGPAARAEGEANERQSILRNYRAVVSHWMAVVRKDGQLTWIMTGNGVLLPIVPIILAVPKYLTGELSLGAMMQLAAAYVPVQAAFAWGVENFRAIANWHASARRLVEVDDAMRGSGGEPEPVSVDGVEKVTA